MHHSIQNIVLGKLCDKGCDNMWFLLQKAKIPADGE